MLRFIISFALALCGHWYLFQYNLDLSLDAPPQLISDSSVSVTLNQAPPKQPNNVEKESTQIQKLEPKVIPALTPPPPIKSHPPSAKRKISRPIAIKNAIQKEKKTIKPPEPEEVYESAPVKEDSSFEEVSKQPPQKKQTQNPVETANRIATPASLHNAVMKPKKSVSMQTASSVIKARPLYQHNPKPEYPNLARRRGWEGIVSLLVEVTVRGEAASVRIRKSCGYKILDKSALRAVKSWRFHPGTRDGKQSQSTVIIPVHFSLK